MRQESTLSFCCLAYSLFLGHEYFRSTRNPFKIADFTNLLLWGCVSFICHSHLSKHDKLITINLNILITVDFLAFMSIWIEFILILWLLLLLQPFYGPWTLSGTTQVSWYQKGITRKVKPIWIYWSKRQWMAVASAWHQLSIWKSASRRRRTTMPASHHSVFYRPDALPAAQPTASKH